VVDSLLFVYQRRIGEVWRLDLAGRQLGSFGREGRGPGEFAVRGETRVQTHGRASWLDVSGDTVAVFDGNDVQWFTRTGDYWGHARALHDMFKGLLFFSKRIRVVSGGVLVDVEQRTGVSWTPEPQARPYGIWFVGETSFRRTFAVELPPLPREKNGAQYQSLREAQPLWDLTQRCVVVSDGSSPWLWVAALDETFVDTLQIPLPQREARESEDEATLMRRMGASRRRSIPPALPLHVRDLAIDPDGWVWLLLLPAEPGLAEGLEVLRVPIGRGEAVVDTVPAFPVAFGPPGTFYGIVRDSDGYRRLARFSARGAR
jgi:hypothetical protein